MRTRGSSPACGPPAGAGTGRTPRSGPSPSPRPAGQPGLNSPYFIEVINIGAIEQFLMEFSMKSINDIVVWFNHQFG